MPPRPRLRARPGRRAAPFAALLAATLALAACARPGADAYLAGAAGGGTQAIGANASGEACTLGLTRGGSVADIFCGSWKQSSAVVERQGPGTQAQAAATARQGAWRSGLDQRFACAEPVATTILSGVPATLLSCTRRVGGWPQVALAASVDGTLYTADGILPDLPVIERTIARLAGRAPAAADAAGTRPAGGADALLAARLAAQSFRAGDVGAFDALIAAGARANLSESFAEAEQSYRAALALQRKALGDATPDAADTLMAIALQLSDQGRFAEAEPLFDEAARLAPRASDPLAGARLAHYRGLDAANQDRWADALAGFGHAEAAYAGHLPPELLAPSASSTDAGTLLDPQDQAALMGVIETRRNRAIALRRLGRTREANLAMQGATELAAERRLARPVLTARLYRTAALGAGASGEAGDALPGLARSAADFDEALPGSRPFAETALLRAGALLRSGDAAGAVAACRAGLALLTELESGAPAELLNPCLDAFHARAEADPGHAQPLLAEMFEASQLAQGSVTGHEIALASARLAAGGRDPQVAAAIRRRQDATATLQADLAARDALGRPATAPPPPGTPTAPTRAALDATLVTDRAALADADAALQGAAPNYGQLVQRTARTADVFAALAPGEAFAAITLGANGGWSFVLRDARVAAVRTTTTLPQMAALVARLRHSIELGEHGVPRLDTDAAQAIWTDTLGPLDAALQGVTALVVAPTGPLLSLPFGVLLTGPASPDRLAEAPFLVRRMAVTHVPAAANFVSLRRIAGTSRATRPWFGFGDFVPVTRAQAERSFPGASCQDSAALFAALPRLPYAPLELEAARKLLGGSQADELLGPAYTTPAVLHASLKDVRVLHFAAHALLPAELRCESDPAIVTSAPRGAPSANGALLTASDVVGLDLDADTVILSACNSGGPGTETGGESLSGLARAFFYAGSRSLLVTHWSVNDQVTALLVATTLKSLADPQSRGLAQALRTAQLSLLDRAGHGAPAELAHPFYWSAFALIGEGGPRSATRQAAL